MTSENSPGATASTARAMPWLRYLAFIATGNVLWEVVQLPLYEIWTTGTTDEMVYSILHCSAGDVLIAALSLAAAVLLVGRARWSPTNHARVAAAAISFGLAYTIFSEWHNTMVMRSWAYSSLMPTLPYLGTGLAPLAQWIFLPLICFRLVRHGAALRTP